MARARTKVVAAVPYAFITSKLNYRYTHFPRVMLCFLVYRLRLTTVNASPELQPLCNHNRRIGVLKTSGKIDPSSYANWHDGR